MPLPGRDGQPESPQLHLGRLVALIVAVAAIVAVTSGCGPSHAGPGVNAAGSSRLVHASPTTAQPSPPRHSSLTAAERARAVALARQEAARERGTVTSASATVGRGIVTDSNIGSECLSGRLLHVKLIGSFPHIVVSGVLTAPGDGQPLSNTVHALLLTADAVSGRPCLLSVQTGKVGPARGATVLDLDAR
jgi:hypothetical protein